MLYSISIYSAAFLLSILNVYLVENKYITFGRHRLKVFNYIWKFIFIFYPLIIIYGWRYNVGVDYPTYLEMYQYLKTASLAVLSDFFAEPGYVILNILAGFLFKENNGIFILSGIVICGLVYLNMLSYSKWVDKRIVLFVFLMTYWGFANNGVRQMIAILIVLFGYQFLLEKRYYRYILICLTAALFHTSAIYCIAMIFINYIRPGSYRSIKNACFIIGGVFWVFSENILGILASINVFSRYSKSLTELSSSTGLIGSFGFLLYLIPTLLYIEKYQIKSVAWDDKWKKLLLIYYIQIPFQCFGAVSLSVERMALYFSCTQILLVPNIIKANRQSEHKRANVFIFCVMWYIFYFIVTNLILEGNGLIPFQFWKS